MRSRARLALSTLADAVGACATALDPLRRLVEAHVMAAERLHGDDTTVPMLAKGKTDTGRLWIYVRDDQPFGGKGPPAAIFHSSRDRRGEHPQRHLAGYAGILQADAYDGYNRLYLADRKPGPILEALCWAMRGASSSSWPTSPPTRDASKKQRRRSRRSPSRRSAASTRCSPSSARSTACAPSSAWRSAARGARPWSTISKPRCARARQTVARHDAVAKAIQYMLNRWPAFTLFLDDGRVCMTNNAAERGLRGVRSGGNPGCSAGLIAEGERAAVMYSAHRHVLMPRAA